MNGENFLAASLAAQAQAAIASSSDFAFTAPPEAESILFRFLPVSGGQFAARSPTEWFGRCLAMGAQRFGCELPLEPGSLAPARVLVDFSDGRRSAFAARWFQASKGRYTVAFQERLEEGGKPPLDAPRAALELRSALEESASLASRLGLQAYSACFGRALSILRGEAGLPSRPFWPALGGAAGRLFDAAFASDVFEHRGGWGALGRRCATEAGALEPYDRAVLRLFLATRRAAMAAAAAAGCGPDKERDFPAHRPGFPARGLLRRLREVF
ncbi:hypothetical protein MUN46_008260 [Mesosutterella sp. AGMB02718]|uniref:Uncharacterized protein n=1 Tax=Mesosutterella faecium TaxID=2925194 RepID=A0ABT7INF8_9BURK|nr:hypothetical protein [Mesosutterella sp. AGMB02718]MDL2059921.1 hypothetical protein [Mesosutterella sp. AGMB02718]